MEYLKSVLSAAALVSVASAFAPWKESVRRAVLCALTAVFLLFVIPRAEGLDIASWFSSLEHTDESVPSTSVYGDAWQSGVDSGIKKDLCASFDLQEQKIEIESRIVMENNTVTISFVTVTLYGENATADAVGMARYIEKNYGCASEIKAKLT